MQILWTVITTAIQWMWILLNFIRKCIFNILLFAFIAILIKFYLQIHYSMQPIKGALIMDLTGIVVDMPKTNTKFSQFGHELLGYLGDNIQENSLFDITSMIRQAKNDDNITGLVLILKNFITADQPSLEYIGKTLSEFRTSGKPIYAISDNYSQTQYFLASYANKIYLTQNGMVDLHGIATNNFYYKSLLHKLKINSHIFRVGIYKSAVEPFLRNNMSYHARAVDLRWVNQLWKHYLTIVAINRNITPRQLFSGAKTILNTLHTMHGDTAKFALVNKLVDKVSSRYDIEQDMIKLFGWNIHTKNFNSVSMYDYHLINNSSLDNNQIAVIFVNGTIIDGVETPGMVNCNTIVNQIRDARLNPAVKAVVFRVNSPGGSMTASEMIRTELTTLHIVKKPIVVSMGGVAASGGYWISTPANYIFASNDTLTGSIGIFGVINTIEKSLNSIGIYTDGVNTSPLANLSFTKTLPHEIAQMMQINIEHGYHNFLTLVAKSRHKTIKEIDKIGQGHVWIGSDAIKNGLIDSLGNFDDAVHKAASLAHIKQYKLNWYMNSPSFIDICISKIISLAKVFHITLISSHSSGCINHIMDLLSLDNKLILYLNDPKNIYALCSSCVQIIK